MEKTSRNPIILLLALLVLFCFATPMLQLGILAISKRNLNLYYESEDATAPIVITFSGVVSEFQQKAYGPFFRALRGVHRGWYSPSAKITLKIGDHYSETKQAPCEVTRLHKSDETYACTISACFDVSANNIVPYMILPNIEDEEPIIGTLPYEANYTLNINDAYSRASEKVKGIAYIQIVGDVSDYFPPSDEPPDEPDEINGDDLPLDDTEYFGDFGGSKIYSDIRRIGSWVWLLIGTGIVVIGLGLYRRKR